MIPPDLRFKSERDFPLHPFEEIKEVAGQESWRGGSEVDESSHDEDPYGDVGAENHGTWEEVPEGGWE